MLNIVSHAYWSFVYFGEMSVQICCPFVNHVACVLSFTSSFIWLEGLYQTDDLHMFSPSLGLVFAFLMVSFDAQKF